MHERLKLARVRWFLGQSLLPEHLLASEQALSAESYLRSLIAGRSEYGVARLRWNEELLSEGVLAITEFTAVMRDGVLLDVPRNAVLPPLTLAMTGAPRVPIYLHLLESTESPSGNPVYADDPLTVQRVVRKTVLSISEKMDRSVGVLKLAEFEARLAEAIRPLDADIVCAQKLFDSGTRKYLMDALVESYPYQYGPANCDCSVNLTSGVVVFSRLPLSDYHEITFKRSAGSEKLSNKGALLVKGNAGGHPFQIVATHLQGDDVAEFVPAMQEIRNAQMDQINDELIKPHADPDVPLILCGDLNTPRYGEWRKRDPQNLVEGSEYKRMVELFGLENGPEFRITLDASREHNDIADDSTGRTEEFDYVLLHKGKADMSGAWERVILRHPGWAGGDDKRQDLSYRWSTKATFTFRQTR